MNCRFCLLLNFQKLAAMQTSRDFIDPHLAYRANLEMSLRLWPLVALLEIGVRNRFADELERAFGKQFFSHGSEALDARLNQRLQLAVSQANARGFSGETNAIVSSLSFGFWAIMLRSRSETRLWVPALRHAFRGNNTQSRQIYYQRLRQVTVLRNRIAHHENILHFDEGYEVDNIVWLLEALEPGASRFAKLDSDIPLHPVE